jgi:transposase-like protein
MGKEGSHRRYDAEFKREAVRLVTERGLPVEKAAEDLGIHPNMLGHNSMMRKEKHIPND